MAAKKNVVDPQIEEVEEVSISEEMDELVEPLILKVTVMITKVISIVFLGATLGVVVPSVAETVNDPTPVAVEQDSKIPEWMQSLGAKAKGAVVAAGSNAKSAWQGQFKEAEIIQRLQDERDQLVTANANLRREVAAASIGISVDHSMATNCAVEVVNYLEKIKGESDVKQSW